MATVAVAPRRNEHLFFVAAALTLLAIVVVGFAQSYFLAGMVFAPLPSIVVHIHAILFVGWILLFMAQIAHVIGGRTIWHIRFGTLMGFWAAAMVVFGPLTAILSFRRPGGIDAGAMLGDFLIAFAFAVLVWRALAVRRDSPAHKRLMLMATAALIAPALARLNIPPPLFLGLYFLVPVMLIVWDAVTLHRLHRATMLGAGLIFMITALTIVLPGTHAWQTAAQWIKTA